MVQKTSLYSNVNPLGAREDVIDCRFRGMVAAQWRPTVENAGKNPSNLSGLLHLDGQCGTSSRRNDPGIGLTTDCGKVLE